MLGEGEFFDLLETSVFLKMRYQYDQAELDSMVPYHYQLKMMMIEKHLREEAERNKNKNAIPF